ncbi:Uncharacterized protein APZ42_014320 [Daphnia magna]|uniref:Uncharacterized protein n=1 Tax=Daphnia magna TaxID=35525 RepID=A0A162Q7C1_9CRUS|nr:Uncharacterized protein APZ42_014320 [Daphnia magna]
MNGIKSPDTNQTCYNMCLFVVFVFCFVLFLQKKKCTGDGNVRQSHVERSHFLFNLDDMSKLDRVVMKVTFY